MEESGNLSCLNSDYDGAEDVILDLDMFYDILDEDSDPSQKNPEVFPNDGSAELLPSEAGIHYDFVQQIGISNSGSKASDGLFDSALNPIPSIECGKLDQDYWTRSLGHDSKDGSKDWLSLVHRDDAADSERIEFSHCQMQISCISLEPRCSGSDARHMPCFVDNLDISDGFKQVEGNNYHNSSSQPFFAGIDERFGKSGALVKKSVIEASGQAENCSSSCLQMSSIDASGSSHMATSYDSGICLDSKVISDFDVCHSCIHYSNDIDNQKIFPGPSCGYFPSSLNSQLLSYSDEANTTDVREELFADSACAANINTGVTGDIYFPPGTEFSSMDNSNAEVWKFACQDGQHLSVNSGDSSFDAGEGNYVLEERKPSQPVPSAHLNCSMEQVLLGSDGRKYDKFGPYYQNYCIQLNPYVNQKPTKVLGCSPYSQYGNSIDQCAMLSGNTYKWNLRPPANQIPLPSVKQSSFLHSEREVEINQNEVSGSHFSELSSTSLHGKSCTVDDDEDLCIIEAISHPAPTNRSKLPYMSVNALKLNADCGYPPFSVEGARSAANNERHILQVALQDLSQPNSEIYPPEGVLAVPLLRHQRIALSWMVQKETAGLCCSGGILADDQGLGKTVSTIALILKERPPPAKCANIVEKTGSETFDLDEDDVINPANCKKEVKLLDAFKTISTKDISSAQAKGRPSAGTLIVCPTSVLRQWADELHTKVTKETNLSVLVYHGNRTKDPYELAKYDVVITTYSIVSMEVPKQPLVNRDGEELVNYDGNAVSPTIFPSSKKRKNHPISNKKSSKKVEGALLESVSGPLAKVAWFRVVLDEAQSIKNHRTQVARACWGLRAKRRWCLSGTPIQNAIDDLYSYFRFLRYDPYAVYKSFCSTIKFPISRSPTRGYRKLQAVLKTIMLRRTKGTMLDGQPIISLPPKFVELRRVEFSDEERDFYSRLEADSRAQFKEYADAGTVKQNYVNILLMLLRLRQACDHPLLVNYDSNSLGKNSIEMAKKLPREKQECLLNFLEASLALCAICNDSPEDAVVSICGHVFCNQCICEHLTGDENQCPTAKCKVQLTKSSVFSKATLSDCLSDQTSSSPGSCSEVIDEVDFCSKSMPTDSSKIKAALEFLLTLCKPQASMSSDASTGSSCTEISDSSMDLSDNCMGSPLKDCPQNRSTPMNEKLNNAITVTGGKAIVFSQWTRMLDLFEAALKSSSIQYRRLDGTMSVVSRDKAVKEFNALPEVSVMIMSLKAASLGLNMVAACNVVMLDLWWNPTTEDQAIDRAHRIGQNRPVTVLRLTVRDTVEDRILALQQRKRAVVASAFGEDGAEGRQSRLTVKDLEYLFMA